MSYPYSSIIDILESTGEEIGVIGSPSSNIELTIDLRQEAINTGLAGSFCVFRGFQDNRDIIVIGQISSVNLRNPALEKHPIKRVISSRGEAPPLTENMDVRTLSIVVTAAYYITDRGIMATGLNSVPPTGTRVYRLSSELINALVRQFQGEIFYLGRIYGTDIPLPMIFRHFGSGERGLGEAIHIGVFGKTGSGKSVLSKMILSAYARHQEMSILVLDPQGEFSREYNQEGVLRRVLSRLQRNVQIYGVAQLALTRPESLRRLLIISRFLSERLLIRGDENKEIAADLIVRFLTRGERRRRETQVRLLDQRRLDQYPWRGGLPEGGNEEGSDTQISLRNTVSEDIFRALISYLRNNVNRIYVDRNARERLEGTLSDEDAMNEAYYDWVRIANLFTGDTSIEDLARSLSEERTIIIIDLSEEAAGNVYWNESVRAIIINELLYSLRNVAENRFRTSRQREEGLLNLLIIIDEAHRFVPEEKPENEDLERLKSFIIDSVRTTRKYGIGWMFISQTVASLDKEILNGLRYLFFGYGLSWGSELRALNQLVGEKEGSLAVYRSFRDPQTMRFFGMIEYPFMVIGPVSPLTSMGRPIFFTALDYFNEFFNMNFSTNVDEQSD